jgi:hypothetical protein
MSEMTATEQSTGPAEIARQSKLGPHLLLRWLGAWTDFIVLFLFLLVPEYLLGKPVYQATLVIWLGAAILYFPIGEGIWGRTLGKLVTGMIVVDKDGTSSWHPEGRVEDHSALDRGQSDFGWRHSGRDRRRLVG